MLRLPVPVGATSKKPGTTAGSALGTGDAGGRAVCRMITVTWEASTGRGSGNVTGPCALPVSCVTIVRASSLNMYCSRLTTRCCSHSSFPPVVLATHPGVTVTAATTWLVPKSTCSTCPSTAAPAGPRTHTHAESRVVSVSVCADVEPAGQSALAVNAMAWSWAGVGGMTAGGGVGAAATAGVGDPSSGSASEGPEHSSSPTMRATVPTKPAPRTPATRLPRLSGSCGCRVATSESEVSRLTGSDVSGPSTAAGSVSVATNFATRASGGESP